MTNLKVSDTEYERTRKELEEIKHALDESTIVAVTDRTGKITYVNEHFCRISKYSRDELLGKDHRIINSGYHPKKFFTNLWKTISKGHIWRGEIRNRAKDGSHYWVATTIVPLLGGENKPCRYVAIRHDITERKRAESELAASEVLIIAQEELVREQKELLEQTYNASYIWNLEDGISYWNKNAEALYGYTIEDIFGQKPFETLKAVYPVSFDDYFESLSQNGHWEGEITQVTKAGKKLCVESRQVLKEREDGKLIVLETSRDITGQQEANDRIRQQASLLEKTSDAILVCDLSHKIIFWNRGAEYVYGWRTSEVLGKDICETVCGGDRSGIEKALSALESGDEWQEEAPNVTRDGERITVISRWTLVRNDLGQPDYILVVNTDITELMTTRQQLFRAQRLESIGTLAGGIAHDLNNVLSPILMAADMLQSDSSLAEKGDPWLSIIRENTERGAALIKQVLSFAKGGGEFSRVRLQPRHLIKDLIEIIKNTFPQDIEVEQEIDPDLSLISADPTQVEQVLMNLAVNAKDAMSDNGGVLEITARNETIGPDVLRRFPDARPGPYVVITVGDNGSGISSSDLERIWDPFFTTKETGKGTGLGLSIALSIAQGHDGFMDVQSSPGEGTSVSFYVPAVGEIDLESTGPRREKSLQGNGETILIVDDEEDILRVASAILEQNGYRVVQAADGIEAMDVFARYDEIKLVITDMSMPNQDGAATIRLLRAIDSNLRIIAASGLDNNNRTDIGELGIETSLLKPYSAEKLLSAVKQELNPGP